MNIGFLRLLLILLKTLYDNTDNQYHQSQKNIKDIFHVVYFKTIQEAIKWSILEESTLKSNGLTKSASTFKCFGVDSFWFIRSYNNNWDGLKR